MLSPFDYDYLLPEGLIAQTPAEPRDSARLFVYDTRNDTIAFDTFRNIGAYVPKSLFVMNDTKVVPSRLVATRANEREMELFILMDEGWIEGKYVHALVDTYVEVGELLTVQDHVFEVIDNKEKWMVLLPHFPQADLEPLLFTYGVTPIPPYIEKGNMTEAELRARYQSILASCDASVAAPTASLHFTHELVDMLKARHARFATVTLHVGLGTFAPIFEEQVTARKLHRERFEVSDTTANAIAAARTEGVPIVGVGTTVVRTLESAKDDLLLGRGAAGATDIFIYPPHQFTFPDALVTNFHVPKSSLMCMVDAYLAHKHASRRILDLYHIAMREHFRFYSFGDAMLIV